jgi:hypothetical protein
MKDLTEAEMFQFLERTHAHVEHDSHLRPDGGICFRVLVRMGGVIKPETEEGRSVVELNEEGETLKEATQRAADLWERHVGPWRKDEGSQTG